MADNTTSTERYFLLYKRTGDHESTHAQQVLIGFAERTPNLTSLSITNNELDEYYFNHRLNADLAVRSTLTFRFCTLFEDEAIRLCSLAFKYDTQAGEIKPNIFIVNPRQPGDKNSDCRNINIELKTFRGVTYATSPILHCAVTLYPRGLQTPPIIFHIIPHLSNKTSVFLVQPINSNKYKLTKHLENVWPLTEKINHFVINQRTFPGAFGGFRNFSESYFII